MKTLLTAILAQAADRAPAPNGSYSGPANQWWWILVVLAIIVVLTLAWGASRGEWGQRRGGRRPGPLPR